MTRAILPDTKSAMRNDTFRITKSLNPIASHAPYIISFFAKLDDESIKEFWFYDDAVNRVGSTNLNGLIKLNELLNHFIRQEISNEWLKIDPKEMP